MGEKFQSFRRRHDLFRLLGALLTGLGVGMLTAGVLNLLTRLGIIALSPSLPFLVGGGAALPVLLLLLLVLRLDDKGLARLLDSELALNERVETMQQYKNEDSALLRLQREDSEAVLSAIPAARLRFKRAWLYIAVFLLGAAMLTVSFFFKNEEAEEPPAGIPEVAFELSAFQEKALLDLALEIEASDMQEPYRANTAALIRGLIEVLKASDTVREKDAAVTLTMTGILSEVDASSYAVEVISALWATSHPPLRELARALNYYEWPRLDELERFNSSVKTFRTSFNYIPGETPKEVNDPAVTETEALLLKASSGITGVLSSVGVPDTDALFKALTRLAAANEENADGTRVYGLARLAELIVTSGYESATRELDETVTALSGEIFAALLISRENTGTGEQAVERLAAILSTPLVRFERPSFADSSSDGGGGQGSDEELGGGAISGGTEYGSDDLIYDPYTNTYVPYGTVLDRYYALVIGSIENGNHTEEERTALMKYFSILYGGFEQGEESNE